MTLKFEVRTPKGKPDVADVRYDCPCGCHPSARYQRGSADAGHEHCCCGNVHFAGAQAEAQLRAYLEERKVRGLDADVEPYAIAGAQAKAPWGEVIEIAYALPQAPRS